MPSAQANEIIDRILDAMMQSGATDCYHVRTPTANPKVFHFTYNGATSELWAYAWTITFGGRPKLPNERRIQMTSVSSPLAKSTGGYTAILGYHPETGMFAGFDLVRHQTFTSGSPSIQIDVETIRDAENAGISFCHKDNAEIAVGIRPEQLMNYLLNSESLHEFGGEATFIDSLKASIVSNAPQAVPDAPDGDLRNKTIQNIVRLSRDANFGRIVKTAYANRCAFTGMQFRLLDAAHILPVAVPGSSDNVVNGIALSPTMHRAYDSGIVYFDEAYRIQVNQSRLSYFATIGLAQGIEVFQQLQGISLLLPSDPRQRPNTSLIKRANQIRKIPGY